MRMDLGKLGRLVKLRMLSGKHAGLEIRVAEIVLEPTKSADIVRVTLPGLEGEGQVLPDDPANN